MNRDFAETLSALCDAGADFLIVGAHALAAQESFVIEGQGLPFLSRVDLARNKRAAGRPKDLVDLAALEGES